MILIVRYYSDLSFYNVKIDEYNCYTKLLRNNNALIQGKLYKRRNKIVNRIVLA